MDNIKSFPYSKLFFTKSGPEETRTLTKNTACKAAALPIELQALNKYFN